ncbi:hypothetical protein GQ42DRAFT_162929 [Ramicandelaber brevisporus]|nr:hypothetical protein GQ42DRAFT_162929 [Ramicandelaber brevisporus]
MAVLPSASEDLQLQQPSTAETAALTALLNSLKAGTTPIVSVVAALQAPLVSDEPAQRVKACRLLTKVLQGLVPGPDTVDIASIRAAVPPQAVRLLIEFFNVRLTDAPCVPALIQGMSALSKLPSFAGSNGATVLNGILSNLSFQSFPQSVRYDAYSIINYLMSSYPQMLSRIQDSSSVVGGFVQALDGEKDPRNLLLAFRIMKNILQTCDSSSHLEDVFEVLFCYFPVTFKAPSGGDPLGITPLDLKHGLRDCLTCIPSLGAHVIPALVDKLSSTSKAAKVDAFDALSSGSTVFDAASLRPHVSELTDIILEELIHGISDDAADTALNCLSNIFARLDSDSQSGSVSEVNHIISTANKHLTSPDLKHASPIGRILVAVAQSSPNNAQYIVNATIPLVEKLYPAIESQTLRKRLLSVLLDILGGVSRHSSGNKSASILAPHATLLCDLFAMSIVTASYDELRSTGLRGLAVLILIDGLLNDEMAGAAILHIGRILIDQNSRSLHEISRELLVKIATKRPEPILQLIIPELLSQLNTLLASESSQINQQHQEQQEQQQQVFSVSDAQQQQQPLSTEEIASTLEKLGAVPALFESVISGITLMIDPSRSVTAIAARTFTAILTARFNSHQHDQNLLTWSFDNSFTPVLTKLTLVDHSLSSNNTDDNAMDIDTGASPRTAASTNDFVESAVRSVSVLVRNMDASLQPKVIQHLASIILGPSNGSAVSIKHPHLVAIYCAAVAALRPSTIADHPDIASHTRTLLEAAGQESQSAEVFESVSRAFASLVNKHAELREQTVAQLLPSHIAILENPSATDAVTSRSATFVSWVTRALAAAGDQRGIQLCVWALEQLRNPSISATRSHRIADMFSVIVVDGGAWTVTKETHARVTLLHKQKMLSACVPVLVSGFEQCSNTGDSIRSANYLVALSHFVRGVPKQVLLGHLAPLIPLLVQSLHQSDAELKLAAASTLEAVLADSPTAIPAPIASELVFLFIQLAVHRTDPSNTIALRCAALRCAALYPEVFANSDVPLSKLKGGVVRQLTSVLDDPKRLVRREAVNARNRWYLVGV